MKQLLFIFFLLSSTALTAQSGCDITIRLNGYTEDTLFFGHTFGRRAVPDFPAARQADGSFRLHTDEPLAEGLYAIVYQGRGRRKEFLSCWLVDGQRKFTIETTRFNPEGAAKVEGSEENALLYQYLDRYEALSDDLDDRTNDWKVYRDEPAFRAMVQQQEALHQYQSDFIRQHPGTRTAAMVAETLFLVPSPDPKPNWQTQAANRHRWFRQHYFDRMDLGGGKFLQDPLWVERTDHYFAVLPPPEPDSTVAMIEEIFQRLRPDPAAYHYYFGYIMNSISKMSRYRTDEAFVHFVREYVDQGKADFLSADRTARYRSKADGMEPLFVGKTAPDVTLTDRNGIPVSVHGVQARYTLLVFWMYDCGHCKKELPIVKKIYEESLREKGVKVISVCSKSGDDTPKCWEFADAIAMPADWYVVNDPQRRTRFSTLYNVRSFPRLLLLDADKKIVFKLAGSASEKVLARELARAMGE